MRIRSPGEGWLAIGKKVWYSPERDLRILPTIPVLSGSFGTGWIGGSEALIVAPYIYARVSKMKNLVTRSIRVVVLGLMVLCMVPSAMALPVADEDVITNAESLLQQADAAPGEYLVQFREMPSWDRVRKELGELGVEVIREYRYADLAQVKVPETGRVRILERIAMRQDVVFIEPNYIMRIATVPDDPLFDRQWGLENWGDDGGILDADIDAPGAWDIETGSPAAVVAVVDTGVDYTHPDLAENIWTNLGETPGNGIDDDGNGYVDDIHGWNAITGTGDPMDDNGHGTHCAGIIGAGGNNHMGVAGVNWQTRIVACKFLDSTGAGRLSNAVLCIDYLNNLIDSEVPVRVHSYSWGALVGSRSLKNAISRAKSRGVLVAAAAGNNNLNMNRRFFRFYPASYDLDNIISVGATDANDKKATFSNYGTNYVDLGAPGVGIWSTVPTGVPNAECRENEGCYASFSGTSMAAPHVAGTAALYFSQDPKAPYTTVKSRILNGVDQKLSLVNYFATGGRLNAERVLVES